MKKLFFLFCVFFVFSNQAMKELRRRKTAPSLTKFVRKKVNVSQYQKSLDNLKSLIHLRDAYCNGLRILTKISLEEYDNIFSSDNEKKIYTFKKNIHTQYLLEVFSTSNQLLSQQDINSKLNNMYQWINVLRDQIKLLNKCYIENLVCETNRSLDLEKFLKKILFFEKKFGIPQDDHWDLKIISQEDHQEENKKLLNEELNLPANKRSVCCCILL